jgi:hypothetical protein
MPNEYVCAIWTKEPDRFRINPSHHVSGPYTELRVPSLAYKRNLGIKDLGSTLPGAPIRLTDRERLFANEFV